MEKYPLYPGEHLVSEVKIDKKTGDYLMYIACFGPVLIYRQVEERDEDIKALQGAWIDIWYVNGSLRYERIDGPGQSSLPDEDCS